MFRIVSGVGMPHRLRNLRAIVPLFFALIFLVGESVAVPIGLPPLSGSRTANDDLVATGAWSGNFSVSWNIAAINDQFQYSYLFETDVFSISHFALQLSGDCFGSDETTTSPCLSNPQLDGSGIASSTFFNDNFAENGFVIGGVKFDIGGEFAEDDGGDGSLSYSFLSPRMPMWGSFFIKSGQVEAYNRGLQNPASTDADFFIAVPDTTTVIPEPTSIALVGGGLLMLGALLRRRRHS